MCNQVVHRFSCSHAFNIGDVQPCTRPNLVDPVTLGHPVSQRFTDFTEICYHCALARVVPSFKIFVPASQIRARVLSLIPQNVFELPGVPLISQARYPTSPTPLSIPEGIRTTVEYEMIRGVWTAVTRFHIENPTNGGGYNPYHGYDVGSLPPGWTRSPYPPSYHTNASNATLSTITPEVVVQPPTSSYAPSYHTSATNTTLSSMISQVAGQPPIPQTHLPVPRDAKSDNSSTAATNGSARSSPPLSSPQHPVTIPASGLGRVPISASASAQSTRRKLQPSIACLAIAALAAPPYQVVQSVSTDVQTTTQTSQRTIHRHLGRPPPVRTSSIPSTSIRFSPPPRTSSHPSPPEDHASSEETTPIATRPLSISPPSATLSSPVPMPAPIPSIIPRRSSILNRSPPASGPSTPQSQEQLRSRTSSTNSSSGRHVRWADAQALGGIRGQGQFVEGATLTNDLSSHVERISVSHRRGSERDDENGALLNGGPVVSGAPTNGHAMNGGLLNGHDENGAGFRDPFRDEKWINEDECMSGGLGAGEERKNEAENAEEAASVTDVRAVRRIERVSSSSAGEDEMAH